MTRPSRPSQIVTNDQAGAALTSLGIRPVGIFSSAPMDQNPILAGVDLAGVESLGEVYGEINVEKLAALAPDLVVVPFDPRQDGPPFGFVDGPVQGQVQAIAPIAAIDGITDPVQVLARFAELAAEDFANFFFDSVSIELAGKYPADLILLDADTAPEVMAAVRTANPDLV